VQSGDVFVTSGIDGTYPPGLVVAKVASVEKNAAYVFAKIVARPAAGVDNYRYVMLLPTPAAGPARPDTKEEQPRKAARGARGKRDAAR
jgi:rod shape-determining protein MreC